MNFFFWTSPFQQPGSRPACKIPRNHHGSCLQSAELEETRGLLLADATLEHR